jgi:hypothetical protein
MKAIKGCKRVWHIDNTQYEKRIRSYDMTEQGNAYNRYMSIYFFFFSIGDICLFTYICNN